MARKKSLLVMLRPQLILIGAIILGVGIFALCYNAGGVNMLSDPQFAPADTQPAASPLPDESPAVSDSPQPTETPKPSTTGRLIPYYAENGMWGYKNTSGQVVIEAMFSDANEFDGEIAFAAQSSMWGLINRSGAWVVEPVWGSVRSFSEDKAAVESGDRWGYIDRTGKLIIDYAYREVGDFHCGRAMARSGSEYGFIDKNGAKLATTVRTLHSPVPQAATAILLIRSVKR